MVSSQKHENCRAPTFRCILSPARLVALVQLLILLGFHPSTETNRITWDLHSFGVFTVHSMYQGLKPRLPLDRATSAIWRSATQLKTQITSWLTLLDRLPISEYLHCPPFPLQLPALYVGWSKNQPTTSYSPALLPLHYALTFIQVQVVLHAGFHPSFLGVLETSQYYHFSYSNMGYDCYHSFLDDID